MFSGMVDMYIFWLIHYTKGIFEIILIDSEQVKTIYLRCVIGLALPFGGETKMVQTVRLY